MWLAPMYQWTAGDTFASTTSAAANQPVLNLTKTNLLLTFRDTSAATAQGFTFNMAATQSVCAACLLQMNSAEAGERNMQIRLSSDTTWSATNFTLRAESRTYDPRVTWGLAKEANLDRVDHLAVAYVDTLLVPTPSTGAPAVVTCGSGRILWVHATTTMPNGYHQAGHFGLALAPLTLPTPSRFANPQRVRLQKGWGLEMTYVWDYMPPNTIGGVVGLNELNEFVASQQGRPVFCLSDGSGLDTSGVAAATAPSWGRIGVVRILALTPTTYTSVVGTAKNNIAVELRVRTWEQQAEE